MGGTPFTNYTGLGPLGTASGVQLPYLRAPKLHTNINNYYYLVMTLLNPRILHAHTILHTSLMPQLIRRTLQSVVLLQRQTPNSSTLTWGVLSSNVSPHAQFRSHLTKQLSSLFSMNKIREDVIPLFYHSLIRFVEHSSGKSFLFQFYPFVHQNVTVDFVVRYKS